MRTNKVSFVFVFLAVFFIVSITKNNVRAQGDACSLPYANAIVEENCLDGTPQNIWDVSGAGDPSIQGFATDISVDQGQTIGFKVDTPSTNYEIEIYRLGYYNGDGARFITTISPSATLPQTQPACSENTAIGLVDCGNWEVSASWNVPVDAVSGIYIARPKRLDTGNEEASHIVFIVRDDDGGSDILFQTSDTTWQAYNRYGGNSLYFGSPDGRAYAVSYNRPFTTRDYANEDWLFNSEFPMLRWLEANGFDVSYSTGVDSDRRGAEILEHTIFMSIGHDEYWSGGQRANVEAARAAGVHLAFFSGNEIFWKTRWESSIDGTTTSYRTLVSYKETTAGTDIDPTNIWTGTWRDPRSFNPEGANPENALTGQIFTVNCCSYAIEVPAEAGQMRFWRDTSIAALTSGQVATLPNETLGYEWDEDLDNGSRPAGAFQLSSTTVNVPQYLQDFGSTYDEGTATHAMTLYRHSSGALVFGAGTVQWAWGLDSVHDRGNSAPDIRMQQATINLLADMNVQPATLQSGLVAATASTDFTAPTSTLGNPLDGASVEAGNAIIISGSATDSGGGVVGGVEVSVDGGTTWRRATGRANWTYQWIPSTIGSTTIQSRAVDDSGNLETPSAGITVDVAPQSCPCSLWNDTFTPSLVNLNDGQGIEVGLRFQSDSDGFITAIRFYKSPDDSGTHIGNLWTNTGVSLGTVNFSGESASGWQEASLPAPVAISANTTYVVSYYSTAGYYAVDDNYFTTTYLNLPLRALTDGEDGANGVYRYGTSGFPTETFQASNYWVDIVFEETVGPDTTPPQILQVAPANLAINVNVGANVTVRFNEPMNAGTINDTLFTLQDPSNNVVAATISYDAPTRTAILDPIDPLAYETTYTANITGGDDLAGNTAASLTWTFTTGEQVIPPDDGPGGPVLVLSHTLNPFSRYYAEILRNEGLNAFTVRDISQVNASFLEDYDVVIVGDIPVTSGEATMLSDWVNAGGNLIAMRPDPDLYSLLGLSDTGNDLSESYLQINTASAPGAGIVGTTMQYHGTADQFNLNGATSIATLYADATTSTLNPAVTIRNVGSNGGQAAAFAFDLARSIVYTRQGNPNWAGENRDGQSGPERSDDLFYGNASFDPQPDWIDLNNVAIPQADEQQRLLANMILDMNTDRMPLPRFWYFPRGERAVVILTGDDHSNNGTVGQFNNYLAASDPGCVVDDWECIRSTSYIYTSTAITNAQALQYHNQGFEIGLHPLPACSNFTPASIADSFTTELAAFGAKYYSLPAPTTNRNHCIAWSDWSTAAEIELANGMRLDTNYYYWPEEWILDRPGMFTGSGLPMRFAREDGSMIDVYQATTQITDESGQTIPTHIATLLDNALGSQGYYIAVTANMHTDDSNHPGANAIVAAAQARGVPVITARQMLEWLDGRNNSSFTNLTWDTNTLLFSIDLATGSNGIQSMIPTQSAVGALTGITRNSNPISYTTQVIKGVEYAIFDAQEGDYEVSYDVDTTPPVIDNVNAVANADGTAIITWTTNELATSLVDYGTVDTALNLSESSSAIGTSHSVLLTGLSPETTYYYRVTSEDNETNSATFPIVANAPLQFTTPANALVDTTVADFSAGDAGTCAVVSFVGDGAVTLSPTIGTEFDGTALPVGWTDVAWTTGGVATLSGGLLTVDGTLAAPPDVYTSGRSLEFVATFGNSAYQHVGFAIDFLTDTYAMFSTNNVTGSLFARTNNNSGVNVNINLGATYIGTSHKYRIDWLANSVVYSIDDVVVHTETVTFGADMRPVVSDFDAGGSVVTVDWLRMSPYASPCTFESQILDAGQAVNWQNIHVTAQTPSSTSIDLSVRTGNTPTPDASWTTFIPMTNDGAIGATSQYLQYQAILSTIDGDANFTPTLEEVLFDFSTEADTTAPTIVNRSPAPDATNVSISTTVDVEFNELIDGLTVNGTDFHLRVDGETVDLPALITLDGTGRIVTITPDNPLENGETYEVLVSTGVTDISGNALATASSWTFTTAFTQLVDTTLADFSSGNAGTCAVTALIGDGAVTLAPTVGSEFGGSALPSGWVSSAWETGGTSTVAGGVLTVNGALATTTTYYTPGRSIEFVATFGAESFQHAGFGDDLNAVELWAMFSTAGSSDTLYARTNNNGTVANVFLGTQYIGTSHTYRIDWLTNSVVFFIDNVVVHTENVSIASNMRPVVSDLTNSGTAVVVDYLTMSPYVSPCAFTSRVLDPGETVAWETINWLSQEPTNTAISLSVRTGNTPTPDGSWSAFAAVTNGGTIGATSRYIQYQTVLSTSDDNVTPVLEQVSIGYSSAEDTTPPIIIDRLPAPNAVDVPVTANVSIEFNEPLNPSTVNGTNFALRLQSSGDVIPVTIALTDSDRLVTLDPDSELGAGQLYEVLVNTGVEDISNNALVSASSWTFTTTLASFVDTTVSDFSAGTAGTCSVVSFVGDGAVTLAPTEGTEFSGTALPAGWSDVQWNGTGTTTVSGGVIIVNDTRPALTTAYGPGRSLEFRAIFTGGSFQHVGFGGGDLTIANNQGTFNTSPWAMFSTGSEGIALQARVWDGIGGFIDTNLSNTYLNSAHIYRIDWTATGFDFYIDGALVHSQPTAIATNMRVAISDLNNGDTNVVTVDWLRLTPYASPCAFESHVFDAGETVDWQTISWLSDEPTDTSIALAVRTGNTPTPDGSWTSFVPVTNGGALSAVARYAQYQAILSATDADVTPTLEQVNLAYATLPPNTAPDAVDDTASTNEDTPVSINVLANDIDPENDILTITNVSDPANGSAVINGTQVDYTPDADFNGEDTFSYTISDGDLTDTATVTVTVTPVNDAPDAVDDTDATDEDTPVTIDVLANDTDLENDTLTITNASDPANGSTVINGSQVDYTPDANFNGEDTFTYTISDGDLTDTATVFVTIGAVNDAPDAVDDTASTDEDTLVMIDVLANDTDPENDALTITNVSDPANGSAVINGTQVDYTPNANFNGEDTFTYTISDGDLTDTATVTVTVTPVNDAPDAVNDTASTDEDTLVSINVLANDIDLENDTLTITNVSDPANGTAVINGTQVDYTPDANFNGQDTFTYTISDDEFEDTATVVVTVNSVNDDPTADAGNDQTVNDADNTGFETVLLDGSGSSDSDGTIVSYAWSSNLSGALGTGETLNASLPVGVHEITLTVTDNNGGTDADTTQVTVIGFMCGGLVQEAESGILSGNFVIGSASGASGGQYVHAPDGSGNQNSPGSNSKVTLCFYVAEAGSYQLRGWVWANNSSNDSFYVTVNGQNFLWDIPINTSYSPDFVSNRGGADPVEVNLPVGNVEVAVALREDGARLDRLELVRVGAPANLPPVANAGSYPNPIADADNAPGEAVQLNGSASTDSDGTIASYNWRVNGVLLADTTATANASLNDGANTVTLIVIDDVGAASAPSTVTINVAPYVPDGACGALIVEAESGTLGGTFVVGNDPSASGGQYVHAPDGTGNQFTPNSPSRVTLCFNVPSAGTYRLRGHVWANNSGNDSFYVTVNGTTFLWDVLVNTTYAQDFVSNRSGADPVEVTLPAGEVEIAITLREDGARLDRMELVMVSAQGNQPPTIFSPGTQTNTVGQAVNLQVNATDDAGGLTYAATGLPPNLSINPTTGVISGTLANNANVNSPYTVTVTVTDGGTPALAVSVTFGWVVNATPSQAVTSFTLINADTDQPIQSILLTSGAVLQLSNLPARINVRANTSTTVGSVVFTLTGPVNQSRTENTAPYALFGDTNGNYSPWTPVAGNYTLTAISYSGSNAGGTAGTPLTITFQIVP